MLGDVPQVRHAPTQPLLDGVNVKGVNVAAVGIVALEFAAAAG
jgi:hypothetical protein